MEQRVARLEKDVDEIKADLKSLVRDVAELKGRVANLATAWQLVGINFALPIGVSGLVFTVARLAGR